MDNLAAMFGGAAQAPVQNPVATPEVEYTAKKSGTSEAVKQVRDELKTQLKNDPAMAKAMGSLSGSIEVTRILGYGVNTNIIKNKEGKTKINEKTGKEFVIREGTSANVGVIIKNIGGEAIDVATEVYQQNEAGVFVGTPTTVKLAPGQEMQLNRKYLTLLASKVEFNLKLANGKLVSGHKDPNKTDLDSYLASFYFKFDDPEISVNDDSVKTAIDVDGEGGKRVVTPEYVATFGYLNNAATRAPRQKSEGSGLTTGDLMAAFIRKMVNNQNM